jgi:hypothetical protein
MQIGRISRHDQQKCLGSLFDRVKNSRRNQTKSGVPWICQGKTNTGGKQIKVPPSGTERRSHKNSCSYWESFFFRLTDL